MRKLLAIAAFGISAATLSSCATISEDECLAGSWQEIGFRDGENGKSRSKLGNYAKTCVKYEVTPNRVSYFEGYAQGLLRFCTYDKGFNSGEYGNSANEECRSVPDNGYFAGHEDGRIIYNINREHKSLIAQYENTLDRLLETKRRLSEDELTPEERKKLRKRVLRLQDTREDNRIDIRAFERIHNLLGYSFS